MNVTTSDGRRCRTPLQLLAYSEHDKWSSQRDFVREERFCVTLRCSAFHTAQPRKPTKRLLIEPMPGLLTAEMPHQQVDLPLHHGFRHRHVEIRLPHVTVPFGNFVFQDQVITKCVPR